MIYAQFFLGSIKRILIGSKVYYAWVLFLLALVLMGAFAYYDQVTTGLITTRMRDQVPWGLYIGNFTFLVGVAAAAVVLVIPAYIYDWGPIKEIVIFGELLAISAIAMCFLFVTVDIGRPDRVWHLFPIVGGLNLPFSILAWDVVVLTLYFLLNFSIATYLVYKAFTGKKYSTKIVVPLVLLSIPLAVSIHTVTAFLYSGIPARPFWNASILAPRFLASAFCSGPALIVMLLQVLRKTTSFKIQDEAIWKVAELMAYAMFLNLFLFGAEIFKEYYSDTHHLIFHEYAFFGVRGHNAIVIPVWTALIFQIAALVLFLIPRTRKNWITLNIGCVMIYLGVYIEKGLGLVIPGLTPDVLGEIYEYFPSWTELKVTAGIYAAGFLLFTFMVKIANSITLGEFQFEPKREGPAQQ
ncbi:MAG: sulfate reduction electron transfer complex DsrMKJOP subunit DsrP [bacterium]